MFIKRGCVVSVVSGEFAGHVAKVEEVGVLHFAGYEPVTVVNARVVLVSGDKVLPLLIGEFEPKANDIESEYRFETQVAL